jgi:hypothetical protein
MTTDKKHKLSGGQHGRCLILVRRVNEEHPSDNC